MARWRLSTQLSSAAPRKSGWSTSRCFLSAGIEGSAPAQNEAVRIAETESDHQERGGNTPCNAIMNVKPRMGGILLCGRLPPVIDVPKGFICTLLAPEGP